MIQIPLSRIVSAEAFAVALEAHRKALAEHRTGEPGQPVPIAHELLDALILRVPESGPVEDRGPDRFEIAPYEVVDDTPAPPAEPTLAERKQALLIELHSRAQAAVDKILPPARARLLSIEYAELRQKPKNKRTAGEKSKADTFTAYSRRAGEINLLVARAAVEIEELKDGDYWTVPTFD